LDQKAQSVIRHDKLGDYKTLHQSPSLTHPQPEAKEKLIEGTDTYILTHIQRNVQRNLQTDRKVNRERGWLRERLAKHIAGSYSKGWTYKLVDKHRGEMTDNVECWLVYINPSLHMWWLDNHTLTLKNYTEK
jgi:hypothetical protein